MSFLSQLGLDRRELRAWAMYDWANSVFMTIGLLVFPIYFADVAAAGLPSATASARFAAATTVSMLIVALLSPFLGAVADFAGVKKKMLAACLLLGAVTTGGLYFVGRGDWKLGALLFILGNIGVTSSIVFYESLLPHIARKEEVDRVSSAGYALGYVGGGLLLAICLLMIQRPAWFGIPNGEVAMRLSFLAAALWWLLFSIPLFRRVPEPPVPPELRRRPGQGIVFLSVSRLWQTLREVKQYKHTLLFLIAFFIYNDGVGTIIRMASIYGREIGIERGTLIGSLLLVQFVGIPFSFLFGMLAGRIGAKRAIFVALAVYFVISVFGYSMKTSRDFLVLAILVGTVQGGSQALSRSLFATMIPKHKSSEFFAFFSVFEKFAGILGPAVFGLVISATGSSRGAILSLVLFFFVGGVLLALVNVEKGQQAAREGEARAAGVTG
ncbi:MAG TPA: MFS transporter [Vicinamibacteria bacterium]|nr:MFS transporter [Vicinamibacteria bacterium]